MSPEFYGWIIAANEHDKERQTLQVRPLPHLKLRRPYPNDLAALNSRLQKRELRRGLVMDKSHLFSNSG